ncbi:MAG: hypothetical protein JJT96_00890 [Opitutales bacterium]|nr:hypothetical protein [Opitutales bacterium]
MPFRRPSQPALDPGDSPPRGRATRAGFTKTAETIGARILYQARPHRVQIDLRRHHPLRLRICLHRPT